MVRDRYLLLLRMIYFTHELGHIDDRLSKIRNIINMLLRKSFILVFQPIHSVEKEPIWHKIVYAL